MPKKHSPQIQSSSFSSSCQWKDRQSFLIHKRAANKKRQVPNFFSFLIKSCHTVRPDFHLWANRRAVLRTRSRRTCMYYVVAVCFQTRRTGLWGTPSTGAPWHRGTQQPSPRPGLPLRYEPTLWCWAQWRVCFQYSVASIWKKAMMGRNTQ